MMTFFPIPYEDELLYSILARYCIASGNISAKSALDDIYGNRKVTAVMDLPAHMDNLINNMPLSNEFTSDVLIEKHTLYPFYSAFIPPERAETIKNYMKGRKGGSIYNKIGLMASSITMNHYFKFCPLCIKEDLEKYGCLYWHRIHQITGILICPSHKVLLQDSKVPVRGFKKHEYIAATEDNCKESSKVVDISDKDLEVLESIVEDITLLVDSKYTHKPLVWFKTQYMNALMKKGLANINGSIKQKELITSFVDYYGDNLLILLQSEVDVHSNHNWLTDLVRKKDKTTHPIRHILLVRFLGISLDDIFNKKINYKPFGDGPWPCLNSAANHYKEYIVKDVKIKYSNDSKKTMGIFKCVCGFEYMITGEDKEEKDKYRVTRVKTFGPVWEEKLRTVVQERLSLNKTAKILDVDPVTVKRYANKLGLETYWQERSFNRESNMGSTVRLEKNATDKKNAYRIEWLELRKNQPQKSKTELRKINSRISSWLYKNDKEWLDENSPQLRPTTTINKRVNWESRDLEVLNSVKDIIQEILVEGGKPKRITVGLVGSRLGSRSLLEKNLNKLPRTKEYLLEHTEDIKTFQIRRIKWAIEELQQKDMELQKWKIYRMAGIRAEYMKDLNEIVNEMIEK